MARPFRFELVKATLRVMADSEKTPAMLLDDLAALNQGSGVGWRSTRRVRRRHRESSVWRYCPLRSPR